MIKGQKLSKNASQGCHKLRKFKSKKASQPFYSIKSPMWNF